MIIIWSILGLALIIALVDSVVRYIRIKKGDPKPLNDEERMLCAKILDSGIGKPWICRRAVDSGKCPCLPCDKLEQAKVRALSGL